ncbi:uncharacterized protein LOC128737535 [Sabethes cyaneus]|uniref:uncharacterized protein LOC128737535 n=1 Tax=Sabethes cyaneus TaxID=53552 RepID=UPI00237EA3C6|nr:uncharacterized protein LOC128737535 [Sabethes cyaneus]
MLGPTSKAEGHSLSSGAGNAGGKMLEKNYLLHESNSKSALTGDDEQLLAALKQQLEKKAIEKELQQLGTASIMSSGIMPPAAEDAANRNNSGLVDSRGCAKPEKKTCQSTPSFLYCAVV